MADRKSLITHAASARLDVEALEHVADRFFVPGERVRFRPTADFRHGDLAHEEQRRAEYANRDLVIKQTIVTGLPDSDVVYTFEGMDGQHPAGLFTHPLGFDPRHAYGLIYKDADQFKFAPFVAPKHEFDETIAVAGPPVTISPTLANGPAGPAQLAKDQAQHLQWVINNTAMGEFRFQPMADGSLQIAQISDIWPPAPEAVRQVDAIKAERSSQPELGYVIVHPEMGVFLGEAMGFGFWSKLDPVGQTAAAAFRTEQEARDFIGTWKDPVDHLTFHRAFVDFNGVGASLDAIRAAGLPTWDPNSAPADEQPMEGLPGASRSRQAHVGPTLPSGQPLSEDIVREITGKFFMPGEKVRPDPKVRLSAESPQARDARLALYGDRESTVAESIVDRNEFTFGVQYRFQEIPGQHVAQVFEHPHTVEHGYGALMSRHAGLWFVPFSDKDPALPSGEPHHLGARLTRSLRYSIGAPFDGSKDLEYITGLEAEPQIGEFSIRADADGKWSLNYSIWSADLDGPALEKATTAIDQAAHQMLKAAIDHTTPAATTPANESKKDSPAMADAKDDRDTNMLPPVITFEDWNLFRADRELAREQNYARDAMDIARQQARAEVTRAAETNEGVWDIKADDLGHGIYVLNAKSPLYNQDRRTVQLPRERGQDIDQFRAAEALWHRYRRIMAGGGHEAAVLLNEAALKHREATMPSANLEAGDVHKNAETTRHVSDEFMPDRPYTVVAQTIEEAKVVRGFLEYAAAKLPRDKQALHSGSARTIIPMVDGQPVLPSAPDVANAFKRFRPQHPTLKSGKEAVGVYVSHEAYDGVRPAMQAAHCADRKIVALKGPSADRSHADVVLDLVDHANYSVAAWHSNVKLLENCDRVVVVTNAFAKGKHRDPAVHLIANAVRAGKPISVFDGEGKQLNQFDVARIAVDAFKSERERNNDELRRSLSNLGSMGSPQGQIFLKALGFSNENAHAFGRANITGTEIAEALGSPKLLSSIVAQTKIPPAALRTLAEDAQHIQRAMIETSAVTHTMEETGMRAITPFANPDEFPKALAGSFPVLFLDHGDGRAQNLPINGIAVLDDAHRLSQSYATVPEQNATILLAGAAPRAVDLYNAIVVVPGPLNKPWTNRDPTITAAASTGEITLVSADMPWPQHASSFTHGSETPTTDEQARAVKIVASLAEGAMVRDALPNGLARKVADAMVESGKPLAIDDSSKLTGISKDNSYVATLRAIVDAKEHLSGHAKRAQDIQAHPDPDSINEKLRRGDRRRIRDESAAISTLTPKQIEHINRTAALLTVIPRDERYGPAMRNVFVAKVNQPLAQKRAAKGATR